MARVLRTSLPDGYFHVYARGVREVPPFPNPADRTAALGMMLKLQTRYLLVVHVACVMSTHYHAMFETEQATLSQALQWLNGRYARAFNKRQGRYGSVFAERFGCRVVGEQDMRRRCDYILENPVKAGLCERPEDWPWSYSRYGLPARIERAA
jgi:putative transposase